MGQPVVRNLRFSLAPRGVASTRRPVRGTATLASRRGSERDAEDPLFSQDLAFFQCHTVCLNRLTESRLSTPFAPLPSAAQKTAWD